MKDQETSANANGVGEATSEETLPPATGYASRWWKRYRVVRDRFAGYEVQCWRVWMPIWLQCSFCNTHSTLEAARRYAHIHARGEVWKA